MNRMPNPESDDDLVIEVETLEQWESELDQFTAQIIHRLRNLSDRHGQSNAFAEQESGDDADQTAAQENADAMRLLQSFRELSQ